MEGIEATSPPNMNADSALLGSERAAMLNEAIELVVEQIIDPLRKRSFAKKLMGTLVTDTKESSSILSKAADDIRNSFHVRQILSTKAIRRERKSVTLNSSFFAQTDVLYRFNIG